jgi:hypothetical protein
MPGSGLVQRPSYHIAVDLEGGALRATLCFPEGLPARLVPLEKDAGGFLGWATGPDGRALQRDGGHLVLPGEGTPGCVRYAVDLHLATRASRHVAHPGGDIALSSGAWLWRPEPLHPDTEATLEVTLPPDVEALLPWPSTAAGHRLDASALRRPAHVAFGRFRPRVIRTRGVTVTYARLGDGEDPPEPAVRAWLTSAVQAVAQVHGRLPVDRVAVMVLPTGPGPDPVAFGMVRRGGGASVMLLVRRGATEEGLVRDWVAVHELAHLLIPPLDRPGAWLSEGLATYYQNVARARAGLLSPVEAWRSMAEGFDRGRRAGTGRTLRDESAHMHRTAAYHRVYWAGAAFALEADVALRTAHGTSLDAVLRSFSARDVLEARPRSAEHLLGEMDALVGARTFSELAARYLDRSEFPDTDGLLRHLGVGRDQDGQVGFDDGAPLADLRQSIMRPTEALTHDHATRSGAGAAVPRAASSAREAMPSFR